MLADEPDAGTGSDPRAALRAEPAALGEPWASEMAAAADCRRQSGRLRRPRYLASALARRHRDQLIDDTVEIPHPDREVPLAVDEMGPGAGDVLGEPAAVRDRDEVVLG